MKDHLKAIVIGSGVAGLASAIRLAVQGFKVTVLEKNEYPGGKIGHFEINGFQFDSGPSLFTQPQNIEELFQLAGENIEDYFQYTSLPVACKYFYEDGIQVKAYTDVQKFAQELTEKVGENAGLVEKYLQRSAVLYNSAGTIFLNHSLHRRRLLLKSSLMKAIGSVKWKYLFHSMNDVNRSSFNKQHTVQLFNRYASYNGSNPYKAPGMLCVIPHLEYNEGIFYPKNGMISIINALYKLALKKDVQFQFNTRAERIVCYDGAVKAVVANKQNIPADIVVSNIDVYYIYKYLLDDEIKLHKLMKKERSSSALVFYWGISKEFPQLDLHNIFFSKNYKAEFDHLFRYKKMYDDPTVYINITSKCEPGCQAPIGKENWFVMVNAPANTGQNWNIYKKQCRTNIIAKLNRMLQTHIEPLIETEETLDPVSIESKTASFMGSLYGTSSNSKMTAFFRHPNFSKDVKGLYFAGGSVHPGGGIPLCLKSAKIMSEIVADDMKKLKH